MTGKYALKLGAVLIGAYLVGKNAPEFGSAFKSGAAGTATVVKAFQGR